MEKTCSRCGGSFDAEAFFGSNHARYASLARKRSVCIGCEQTARDGRKQQNRWRAKARDALNRHADKFIRLGFAIDRPEFAARFGWDLGRMAHEAEHAYGNGCNYCGHRFLSMGHGLADITLDIVDVEQPPFYATNARWVCATCNREKGRTSPRLWGAKLVAWARWRDRQQQLHEDPWSGTLFEGKNISF